MLAQGLERLHCVPPWASTTIPGIHPIETKSTKSKQEMCNANALARPVPDYHRPKLFELYIGFCVYPP